jgi:hypothetical protein
MKMNVQYDALGRIARRGLQPAALVAMVLAVGNPCGAQSGTPSTATQVVKLAATSSTPAQAATADVAPATSPMNAPGNARAKPPAGGPREGVKIHGHWTIDVRNPDGTLDKHLDFENGLCTAANLQGSTGGDALLTGLLFGMYIPGPWQIVLNSPVIPTFPAGGTPGPACGNLVGTSFAFVLNQSNATGIDVVCGPNPYCFPVLTPPALTGSNNGIILAGQFTVPQGTPNTPITSVQAGFGVCPASTTPGGASACVATNQPLFSFSGTYLTGTGPIPAPPTVSGGQTVAVSVQYSFQ